MIKSGKQFYLSNKIIEEITNLTGMHDQSIPDSIKNIVQTYRTSSEVANDIRELRMLVSQIGKVINSFVLAFEATQLELIETAGQIKHMGKKVQGIEEAGRALKTKYVVLLEQMSKQSEFKNGK